MASELPVRCSDNEQVVAYLLAKTQELATKGGLSENLGLTLSNAQRNIANCKTPIKSLKDLSKIKGVGQWIVRLMKGCFPSVAEDTEPKKATKRGKTAKGPRRYVPQKNSVAYALLITLYREMSNGRDFMRKQELIDAAEGSGLSRVSIAQDKGTKPGQIGSSPRDWYTGWSCMKGLVAKGLVAKSSCPAKYMLTDEGQETARECLVRSGLSDSAEPPMTTYGSSDTACSFDASELNNIDAICNRSFVASPHQETTSSDSMIKPTVNNLQTESYLISDTDSDTEELKGDCDAILLKPNSGSDTTTLKSRSNLHGQSSFPGSVLKSSTLRLCTSIDSSTPNSSCASERGGSYNSLAMPPHRPGEKFEELYNVILILDDRENFASRSKKAVDILHSQFKMQMQIRHLPIGDAIWIAQSKHSNHEYVLDFIVERKRVDDLCHSIKDNRYKEQKLRLTRCGLLKLIYLIEGDPNGCEAAETLKTACFTTEILEGFDVQRTTGLVDTIKKYGYLTQAIRQVYQEQFINGSNEAYRHCLSYNEFTKRCQDLERMSVTDLFALQLMQVPQVTEEIALAVVDIYPTLFSLAQAYSLLGRDIRAQEEMLKNKNSLISAGASKNIFKLIWG